MLWLQVLYCIWKQNSPPEAAWYDKRFNCKQWCLLFKKFFSLTNTLTTAEGCSFKFHSDKNNSMSSWETCPILKVICLQVGKPGVSSSFLASLSELLDLCWGLSVEDRFSRFLLGEERLSLLLLRGDRCSWLLLGGDHFSSPGRDRLSKLLERER